MKYTAATLLAGAAVVTAQVALPETIPILGLPFGQQCQQAVLGLFTSGEFSQCFPASALLPLLTSNDSIIPVLDNFMTELCYQSPCSNETLSAAAQQVYQGCQSDLETSNITEEQLNAVFSVYPTLREVLCLKTTDYYTEDSYGGFLGAPPIPISDAYNLTDGAFCVSSVLTQLSAYFGTDITIEYIAGAVSGSNSTAQDLVTSIQPNFLCNGCIFGAVDVIAAAYPGVANVTLEQAVSYANMTLPESAQAAANETLASVMDETCAYVPLTVDPTQLPPGVSISIVESTFENPPADGEEITEDTPTPEDPTEPAPEVSGAASGAAGGLPDPTAVSASGPVPPSDLPTPSADASAVSASLPAVDPSATPAPTPSA